MCLELAGWFFSSSFALRPQLRPHLTSYVVCVSSSFWSALGWLLWFGNMASCLRGILFTDSSCFVTRYFTSLTRAPQLLSFLFLPLCVFLCKFDDNRALWRVLHTTSPPLADFTWSNNLRWYGKVASFVRIYHILSVILDGFVCFLCQSRCSPKMAYTCR